MQRLQQGNDNPVLCEGCCNTSTSPVTSQLCTSMGDSSKHPSMGCRKGGCYIRSVDREGGPPMFFHISEVTGGAGSGIGPGSEVSFAVVPDPTAAGRGDKYNAVQLEVLPAGTVAEERSLPGARAPGCFLAEPWMGAVNQGVQCLNCHVSPFPKKENTLSKLQP